MSAKAIREYDAKLIVSHFLSRSPALPGQSCQSSLPTLFEAPLSRVHQVRWDLETHQCSGLGDEQDSAFAWLKSAKLVAKPDQLIKRRGKAGLLKINATWDEAVAWIRERAGKEVKVESTVGTLNTFIIEPFLPHPPKSEYYICINSVREGDMLLFTHEGGIDVGDVDAKATRLLLKVDEPFPASDVLRKTLLAQVPNEKQAALGEFIERLYAVYVDLHYTYLEINPLVVLDSATPEGRPTVHYLDMAAKLDQTADFEVGHKWAVARSYSTVRGIAAANKALADVGPPMEFPAPFGRNMTREEALIADLDAKTGASLKLTVLNPEGRVWTMVAGGGASVVYSDAIAAHGFAHEMANYGEYSGAPSQEQTYQYARTILDLMTRGTPKTGGKVLIIGGGIANFTNVASTFKGIIRALKEYKQGLVTHDARIYVRRGGPNYQEGLRAMRSLGEDLGVKIQVFGPDDFITKVVPLALRSFGSASKPILDETSASALAPAPAVTEGLIFDKQGLAAHEARAHKTQDNGAHSAPSAPVVQSRDINANMIHFQSTTQAGPPSRPWYSPFDAQTRSFVYGLQPRAVQLMLDFDFVCGRKTPSVAAVIYPFGGHHLQKLYWGTKETLLPVYTGLAEAVAKHPEADTVVNFASSRSVFSAMQEIFQFSQLRSVAIIAEGVPERRARQILWQAKKQGVLIIGPATVGGIKPGCFRIGNTGGMMDNVISSKLYRPGSVAYVSKSGGMSNELNSMISLTTDGVYEGVAIGGDRYPGSTFIDHLLRYEADPKAKLLVLLGEVGGVEEYRVIEAVRSGTIKKPVVAWAIGTCAKMFATEVQFGHAGSMADSELETAEAKNSAMRAAGIIVPRTFEDLPTVLSSVYEKLVQSGAIVPKAEPEVPKVPMDYNWAQELGLIRKPAAFISTISDERGQELLYAGMPISEVFKENIGIGGVMSLLWFKRRLPDYACKFLEMVLMMTADHGPAVSGAHNTIVTARAGKDLISSLVSGLVTIGPRFGGALDGAATEFSKAYDLGQTPREFVDRMRRANKLIPGIGHKVKSRGNPDMRVELVKTFVKTHFRSTDLVDYAIAVEDVTTSKKDTLILNVDGIVATAFVDLLRGSGAFSSEEVVEYLDIGVLNGLFVLGRSIGFIGHYLDQKRLKQPLYRHPYDDIFLQLDPPARALT